MPRAPHSVRPLTEEEVAIFDKLYHRGALHRDLVQIAPGDLRVCYYTQPSQGGAHSHFTVALVASAEWGVPFDASNLFIGVAKKSRHDDDNPEVGRLLALDRALRGPVPACRRKKKERTGADVGGRPAAALPAAPAG